METSLEGVRVERRKAARARCSLPCDIRTDRKTLEGTVRDVSEGGLALEAPLAAAASGDSLELTLKPSGRAPIELVAIVWHCRTIRRNATSEPCAHLGLVLSEAGEDYFDLVASLTPKGRRNPDPPAAAVASASASAPPPAPLHSFSVQVAQAGSPRTRRILVRAHDAEGAERRALEETGPGWSIVAIAPSRTA